MICVVANEQLGCCITRAMSRWWCQMKLYRTPGTSPVCAVPVPAVVKWDCFCGVRVSVFSVMGYITPGETSWGGAQRSRHGEHRDRCIITACRKVVREDTLIAGDHRLCSVSIMSTLGDIEWRRECLECLIFNDSCRELYWMLGFMLIWNKLFQCHDYEKIRQYCGFRTLS